MDTSSKKKQKQNKIMKKHNMTHIYHSRDNKPKIKIAGALFSEWMTDIKSDNLYMKPNVSKMNIYYHFILDDRGWSYLLCVYVIVEMESQWHNNLFNEIKFVILTDC